MGFLSSIGGFLGKAGKSITGGLQSGISEGISGLVGRGINMGIDALGPSQARQGRDYAEFMEGAFPGTNPWERLGSSAGGGGQAIQKSRQKAERRNVDVQASSQRRNIDVQTSKDLEIARIHAKVSAGEHGKYYGSSSIGPLAQFYTGGDPPTSVKESTFQRQARTGERVATTGEKVAETGRGKLALDKLRYALEKRVTRVKEGSLLHQMGRDFKDPATAALAATAAKNFNVILERGDVDKFLAKHGDTILSFGAGASGFKSLSRLIDGFLGIAVMGIGKGFGRAPTSVPGKSKIPALGGMVN